MRPWAGAIGLAGVLSALLGQSKPSKSWTVVVGGDVAGYLAPCGCTYPMSGGIKRWATEVRARIARGPTLVLENGGFVLGAGAQDRDKAEAMAQMLGDLNTAAINLTPTEARFGQGELSQLSQLAGTSFVASQMSPKPEIGLVRFVTRGPFLIGGAVKTPSALEAVGEPSGSAPAAARELAERAKVSKSIPILLFDGDEQDAADIAKAVPAIRLIVFSRTGDPPYAPRAVGKTMLVTPGAQGKFLVQLTLSKGVFADYAIEGLGPNVKDDPMTAKIYAAYLRTVERTGLLNAYPRVATAAYAGAAECGSCHAQAYAVWKGSKHRSSYGELRSQGHGADPDCVACHVTALDSDHGFRSLAATPELAFVGCESCHGPGAAHAADPAGVKMPRAGKESCVSCHDPENSPRFDFLTYWKRVEHR